MLAQQIEKYSAWKKLLIVPPLAVGAALVALAMSGGKPPAREAASETARPVRIVTAIAGALKPEVKGYGLIRASRVWDAVAQVSGPVMWINPKAESGALLVAGTELVRIDPTEYEAALAQAEAEHAAQKVKLASTHASLKIEERSVELLKTDLERKRTLSKRGTATELDVETAERAYLAAETKAQALRNVAAETEASLPVLEARLAAARLNLERTKIVAPFDIRISERAIEESQYAARGAVLLKADGTGAAEATAHIAAGRLGPLVRGSAAAGWMLGSSDALQGGPFELDASVVLKRGDHAVTWEARVSRVAASVDPLTQTVGIVVSVDAPYAAAEPGKRPPLTPNTFVEVLLSADPIEGRAIVPAAALRGDKIYVVDAEGRLLARTVKTGLRQGRFVIVLEGVDPGEKVVVSDLIPAVEGMLLAPVADKKLIAALRQAAGVVEGAGQ